MKSKAVDHNKFSDLFLVKPHESQPVIFYLVLFALLGAGLALGRGTADALFFKRYGIEYLPMMFVVTSFFLAAVCTLYAAFADRLTPERFFHILLGGLGVAIVVAWSLMEFTEVEWVYPLYYIIYEIASELVLIHAGLYLSQNMDASQSRRLVPLIFGGSQVGMIIGGGLLVLLSSTIGVSHTVLAWALLSLLAIGMLVIWHHIKGTSPFYRSTKVATKGIQRIFLDVTQGVKFMGSSALLRYASLSLFFMVIMFYVLIYSVNQVYTDTFKTEESLSSFFGILTAVNSTIAILLQFLVANRLLKKLGVKTVNLLFPTTSIVSYIMLLFSFSLPSAIAGSVNKDVVMTAFRNPVWNLMLNALPRNIQGRARAMAVAIVIPLALLSCGGILLLIQSHGNPTYIIMLGFVSAVLYFFFSVIMNRCYVKEIINYLKQRLALPEDITDISIDTTKTDLLEELKNGVLHPDDQISKAYAKSLISIYPDKASSIIVKRLPSAGEPTHDQLIRMLVPYGSAELSGYLWEISGKVGKRTQATCYRALISIGDSEIIKLVPELLDHEYPRLKATGVIGAYKYEINELIDKSNNILNELLSSDDLISNFSGLELIRVIKDGGHPCRPGDSRIKHAIDNLVQSDDEYFRAYGIRSVMYLANIDITWLRKHIERLMRNSSTNVKIACLQNHDLLDDFSGETLLENALEDAHPYIRELAAFSLAERAQHDIQSQLERLNESMGGSPRVQASIIRQMINDGAPKQMLEEYAESKANEAHMLGMALTAVKSELERNYDSSIDILRVVLEERLESVVDLTLQAWQNGEQEEMMEAIRLGISSGDPGFRASGCEALHNLDNTRIGRPLASLLESDTVTDNGIFETLRDVIKWCIERDDPWLVETANHAQIKTAS